jgi:Vitamin B12 dependent methionine synthase, activation domain
MLAQGYRGSRYSFGYPACPNLADQKQLLALLGAEAPRRSASRSPRKTNSTPGSRPRPSSPTTRTPSTSRCETREIQRKSRF